MKMNKSINKNFLQATVIISLAFGISSCNSTDSKEDPKAIAEVHNDAKYNNTSEENDAQFLVNAAEMNLKEIKLSEVAEKNGSVKIVRELGNMILNAHQTTMIELTSLASEKQITIPIVPTAAAILSYDKLVSLKGKEFDKVYCEMMVAGHKETVPLFEVASTNSKDEDIRNWAIATLPNLRMHLDSALNCQRMCESMK
jgi:putative membrane protein